jgi:hypothetical protein
VVKIDLAYLINEHLKTRKPKKNNPRSYFYISEAGTTPLEIFRKLSTQQKHPPKIKRLMEIGKATHQRVYRCLQKMGFLKASEVKVGDGLFHGYVDAVIRLPEEEEMPLEIKTVCKEEFDNILNRHKSTWQSYIQLQLYLHYLNKKIGRILFIEANTLKDYVMPLEEFRPEQRMKEFEIRKNPRIIFNTIKKFKRLKDVFVNQGVMIR